MQRAILDEVLHCVCHSQVGRVCGEGLERFAFQSEGNRLIPITPVVVAESEKRFLPSFSSKVAVLNKLVLEEMAT